jgi:hypothetical protein
MLTRECALLPSSAIVDPSAVNAESRVARDATLEGDRAEADASAKPPTDADACNCRDDCTSSESLRQRHDWKRAAEDNSFPVCYLAFSAIKLLICLSLMLTTASNFSRLSASNSRFAEDSAAARSAADARASQSDRL